MSNSSMLALHDRASRGLSLSPKEQAQLDAWYADQDASEHALLAGRITSGDTPDLQVLIEHSLSQLAQAARHIQELSRQNVALRAANDAIRQQLPPL